MLSKRAIVMFSSKKKNKNFEFSRKTSNLNSSGEEKTENFVEILPF